MALCASAVPWKVTSISTPGCGVRLTAGCPPVGNKCVVDTRGQSLRGGAGRVGRSRQPCVFKTAGLCPSFMQITWYPVDLSASRVGIHAPGQLGIPDHMARGCTEIYNLPRWIEYFTGMAQPRRLSCLAIAPRFSGERISCLCQYSAAATPATRSPGAGPDRW